ncbi:hypothetical protein [Ekhidna sp. To15]|uniref:hypothetical protein n=1 Tax=Ekhidna sp. To15 TaxID=3395267 RepID=UPI003F526FFE
MEISDWNCKAILYVVDINGKAKFGISDNWESRERQYEKDHGDVSIQLIMKTDFDHYWQAELVEQLMKLKLKPFIIPGLHEWLKEEFPLQNIIDCYKQVDSLLAYEYDQHEHIHRKGSQRWIFYKRVYEDLKIYFPNQ